MGISCSLNWNKQCEGVGKEGKSRAFKLLSYNATFTPLRPKFKPRMYIADPCASYNRVCKYRLECPYHIRSRFKGERPYFREICVDDRL